MNLKEFAKDNSAPSFLKVGIYGGAGTGKTRTAFEIASGLIKDKKISKPVAFFDTEKGSDWILPLFKKNNIECFVKKSRTFSDLIDLTKIAEKEASFLIVDSISHVWRELCDSFLAKLNADRFDMMCKKGSVEWAEKKFIPSNKLEFHHWNVIKPKWAEFTDLFLTSNLNVIVCGRSGNVYDFQENENGKKEIINSGTKMATEKELSYEPSLLIELVRKRVNDKDSLFAIIEKDRSDTINGKEFEYIKYSDIKAHVDFINFDSSSKTNFNVNPSTAIFKNTLEPSDDHTIEKNKRIVLCEEIKGELENKYPGTSAENKKIKNELINQIFGTYSWTKVEGTNSEILNTKLEELKKILTCHV